MYHIVKNPILLLNSDTTFYWVDATEEGKTLADAFYLKNVKYINKDKLCEELKIT